MEDERQLMYLDPKQLKKSREGLREVDQEDPSFLLFKQSIAEVGILQPIQIREETNSEGQPEYMITDGHNRWTAALDLGFNKVPCIYEQVEGMAVDERQIISNLHTIVTKPAAFGRAMKRMLEKDHKLNVPILSQKLGVTTQYIRDRLQLNKLPQSVQSRVDRGEINLTNAKVLSELPVDLIPDWADAAANQETQEFVEACRAQAKEHKDNIKAGKEKEEGEQFQAPIYLRKRAEVVAENDNHSIRKDYLKRFPRATPAEVADYMVSWFLHLDPESVELARQKWEAKMKEQKEKAERRKQQRTKE